MASASDSSPCPTCHLPLPSSLPQCDLCSSPICAVCADHALKRCVKCLQRMRSHHRQESSLAELRLSLHLDFDSLSAVSKTSHTEDTQRTEELWMSAHKLLEEAGELETSRGQEEEVSAYTMQEQCINSDLRDKIRRMREKIGGSGVSVSSKEQPCCLASDSCRLI